MSRTGRQYCYSGARVHLTLSWVCIEVIYKRLDISWIFIHVQDRSAILLQRSSSPFDAQLGQVSNIATAELSPFDAQLGQVSNIATAELESLTLSWVCIEVIYKCLVISWIFINVQDRSAILLQRSLSPFDAQLGMYLGYVLGFVGCNIATAELESI
ncbi:hypothetical protein J6590_102005 [Homalodisca vitripennis]|nr:hypothetical protein J6590_102005 [Homalodisca vitripennis]